MKNATSTTTNNLIIKGFLFCSFTLRELKIISLGKRLAISISQRQGVNGSSN